MVSGQDIHTFLAHARLLSVTLITVQESVESLGAFSMFVHRRGSMWLRTGGCKDMALEVSPHGRCRRAVDFSKGGQEKRQTAPTGDREV